MGVCIAQSIYNGGEKPLEVETAMLIESYILNGDKSILEIIRKFIYARPVTVFHIGIARYYIAVAVVNVAGAVALGKSGYVERRSRVNISLCNSQNKPEYGKTSYHDENEHDLNHSKYDSKRSGTGTLARNKELGFGFFGF